MFPQAQIRRYKMSTDHGITNNQTPRTDDQTGTAREYCVSRDASNLKIRLVSIMILI